VKEVNRVKVSGKQGVDINIHISVDDSREKTVKNISQPRVKIISNCSPLSSASSQKNTRFSVLITRAVNYSTLYFETPSPLFWRGGQG
jgi:hypothetical protein